MENDLQYRTKQFSLAIVSFYSTLPKGEVYYTLGKQLLRCGTSVGANTRAAYRGRSKKEFSAKLGIVIEEADECIFWLDLLESQENIKKEQVIKLKQEANELVSIFVSIVKKAPKTEWTFKKEIGLPNVPAIINNYRKHFNGYNFRQ